MEEEKKKKAPNHLNYFYASKSRRPVVRTAAFSRWSVLCPNWPLERLMMNVEYYFGFLSLLVGKNNYLIITAIWTIYLDNLYNL